MQTEKITGIKSVDFRIKAVGHGVVNWNGSPKLMTTVDGKDKQINNHAMPKLRGYTNIQGYWDDGNPKYKHTENVDYKTNKLYISQNCIRHHLFRSESYNLNSPKLLTDTVKLLCSIPGLMRGYVIPKNENKRTSPLLLTDFVDQLGNGNFEQMGRSGSKEKKETKAGKEKSNSLFSKTTFGDTEYDAYGSISMELLQFIPLAADFGRQAMIINNEDEGREVAVQIMNYINSLGNSSTAEAVYDKNYVRSGSIFDEGEAGILLNDVAQNILVNEMLSLIKNLSIRQAKGYMYVDSIEVDYNSGESGKDMMRIKHTPSEVTKEKGQDYAVYYKGK